MPFAAALLALVTSWPASRLDPPPRVRLAIAFDEQPAIDPAVARWAVEESARVWAPYSVAIAQRHQASVPPAGEIVLTVRVALHEGPPGGQGHPSAFGALTFSEGVPEPTIAVFYDDIFRSVIATPVFEKNERDWPVALRLQTIGRVLGRVLAHEIGHFLLRWPAHAATGLMRARHTMTDFTGFSREPFVLSQTDQARWHAVTAAAGETAAADKCGGR